MNDINLREIAEMYAEKGMVVVPALNKRPDLMKGWQKASVKEILKDELAWSKANGLNLVTGEKSGVTVLDIDIIESEKPDLYKTVKEMLPPLLISRKGNPKKHPSMFFQYNGEKTRHFSEIDVDILGDGSNCCLPPGYNSASGTAFKWIGDSLLTFDVDDLPVLSQDLIDFLVSLNEQYKVKGKKGVGVSIKGSLSPNRCRHTSHNRISQLALGKFREGRPIEEIINALLSYDRSLNHDADSLYFMCPSRNWKHHMASTNAISFMSEVMQNNAEKYRTNSRSEDEMFPTKVDGFAFLDEKIIKGESVVKRIPDMVDLARYMKEVNHLKIDDSYRYIYKMGRYVKLTNLGFDKYIQDLTLCRDKPNITNQHKQFTAAYCQLSKGEFNSPDGYLNLNNCVLNIKTKKTYNNSPEFNFTQILSYDYDEKAECPQFIEFLKHIFFDDQNLIDLLGEVLGYTLIGGDPFKHKAFMLFGEGRNGKSTLLDVIKELIGSHSVSNVSMGSLDKPFSVVQLDNKLANIVEETPKEIDSEAFKNIVGGGSLTAAYKGMDEFDLKINTRLFFASNDFPHFRDGSTGLKERLVIIPFKRYIEPDKRDFLLKDKLLKELAGVLNFAVEGWHRLSKNKLKFTDSKLIDDTMQEYILDSDSVARWVESCVEYTGSDYGFESTRNMYESYRMKALMDGFKECGYSTFSRKLSKAINADLRCKSKDGNKRGFKGIKLRLGE